MAEYKGDLKIEGSIGDFSIVKRKDLDKYYVRKKGGPSKKQIAQLPSMKGTREINAEFGGCSKAGTAIRMATNAVRHLSDYNISAPLNAIAKVIQTTDKKGARGQRAIDISTNKDMLPGFSFNRRRLTDSVLRTPVVANIDRLKKAAEVTIPRIIPDVNLKQYGNNTMFRFIVSLGVVSDLHYNFKHKTYEPIHNQLHSQCFSRVLDSGFQHLCPGTNGERTCSFCALPARRAGVLAGRGD